MKFSGILKLFRCGSRNIDKESPSIKKPVKRPKPKKEEEK